MRLCGEALEVVHEPRAAVFGVLVVATDVNRLFRAHLLTIAAEDASELVDLVDEGVAIPFLVFTGNELDAIRRTDLRTEPARHALRLSGFVGEHAVRAAPPPDRKSTRLLQSQSNLVCRLLLEKKNNSPTRHLRRHSTLH